MSAIAQLSLAPRSSVCFSKGMSLGRLAVHARAPARHRHSARRVLLMRMIVPLECPDGQRRIVLPMLQSGYITGYTEASAMSTTPQKRALKRYRKRLNQRGMARFEVLGLEADRE